MGLLNLSFSSLVDKFSVDRLTKNSITGIIKNANSTADQVKYPDEKTAINPVSGIIYAAKYLSSENFINHLQILLKV
jgi:hypothetical protein